MTLSVPFWLLGGIDFVLLFLFEYTRFYRRRRHRACETDQRDLDPSTLIECRNCEVEETQREGVLRRFSGTFSKGEVQLFVGDVRSGASIACNLLRGDPCIRLKATSFKIAPPFTIRSVGFSDPNLSRFANWTVVAYVHWCAILYGVKNTDDALLHEAELWPLREYKVCTLDPRSLFRLHFIVALLAKPALLVLDVGALNDAEQCTFVRRLRILCVKSDMTVVLWVRRSRTELQKQASHVRYFSCGYSVSGSDVTASCLLETLINDGLVIRDGADDAIMDALSCYHTPTMDPAIQARHLSSLHASTSAQVAVDSFETRRAPFAASLYGLLPVLDRKYLLWSLCTLFCVTALSQAIGSVVRSDMRPLVSGFVMLLISMGLNVTAPPMPLLPHPAARFVAERGQEFVLVGSVALLMSLCVTLPLLQFALIGLYGRTFAAARPGSATLLFVACCTAIFNAHVCDEVWITRLNPLDSLLRLKTEGVAFDPGAVALAGACLVAARLRFYMRGI